MAWAPVGYWVTSNWGSLVSVVGLFVSGATLLVAKAARQAAEEAKSEAPRRNLADELEQAQSKTEQVGSHLGQEKWEIVLLRSQKVVTSCGQILRRWGSHDLSEEFCDNILVAQQQAG